jgi:hypothetical protein
MFVDQPHKIIERDPPQRVICDLIARDREEPRAEIKGNGWRVATLGTLLPFTSKFAVDP